jgi:hypothetical protein
MATNDVFLSPGAAVLPDGSASNLAPAMQRRKSSGSAPAPYFHELWFDAATEEWACWSFRMPANYASAPILKIQYKMASATTGAVVWAGSLAAVTDGDLVDVDAKAFATAQTATVTVPGTAGHLDEASIALTTAADSVAAGDLVVVRIARQGAAGGDTATGDAEFITATLSYTTT